MFPLLQQRHQKWFTVKGTKRAAEQKLAQIISELSTGGFVEPTKLTFERWINDWLETNIRPTKRLRTYETYRNVINKHLNPVFGAHLLQHLTALDIQRYYANSNLSVTTLQQHHAVLNRALGDAAKQDLIKRNPAALVSEKPRRTSRNEAPMLNCWDSDEAKRFLEVAAEIGSQSIAFYTLALETGMRKGELCGLKWKNVDHESKEIRVAEQLVKIDRTPLFGPPKNGRSRTIKISDRATRLLTLHKASQAELILANRLHYHERGLVFSKNGQNMKRHYGVLGDPLPMTSLGQVEFDPMIRRAGVSRITFHGLRHTCATLLLKAGTPVHVVAERLGHQNVTVTLEIYAHALPSIQREAADQISSLIGG